MARERLINRRRQGDLGEVSAIEWLTRRGALVSVPLGHSPDYDLVADLDGELLRVQVKTSTYATRTPAGERRYQVQLVTNGGNRSWTGVARRFDPARFDLLFVLVGDGRRWLIPSDRIEALTNVSVGGSKYSEFQIENGPPIQDLVYEPDADALLQSDTAPGEYRSGQTGQTVNLLAMPS